MVFFFFENCTENEKMRKRAQEKVSIVLRHGFFFKLATMNDGGGGEEGGVWGTPN